jgi:putative ATP-dependent endonuclease of OLD family
MKFRSIEINNFRNFDALKVDIGNKNVFFGMNDIGKTNFLFALRYLFDRDMRKRDLVDSDFHKRNVTKNIEIIVCIDITDTESPDTQKLRAQLQGAVGSSDTEIYIRLEAVYNNLEKRADMNIQWGGNKSKLAMIKASGSSFFDIDKVFNVIYINSYIDLHELFKRNIHNLIKNNEVDESIDNTTEQNIKTKVEEINAEISNLSGIKSFQDKLTPSYKKMRDENVSISIKSDFAINYLYSNIVPFIYQDGDDNEYPASGEGRKKLLAYSVYNILSEETAEKKVNLFLIEEPETHLHKSMQSALSHFLFNQEANDGKLNYLFISTHSPFVLSEMDDVNLIRLYNANKIFASSESYTVPDNWKTAKKKLNRALSEAIFADFVLLVEGESECILFERVLAEIDPYYESKGIYVLSVEGIGFKEYINILSALNVTYIIKTDNDISQIQNSKPAKYKQSGLERINGLIKHIDKMVTTDVLTINRTLIKKDTTSHCKRNQYNHNKTSLDSIREIYKIFLSHCDLEEDLCKCLGNKRFCELLECATAAESVKRLKSKKQHIMVELAGKLTRADCQKIYNHYNFACLKAVRNETV